MYVVFFIIIINQKAFNKCSFFDFLLAVYFNFRCYPRLNEGDQVVMINNRDVSQHTHDQVVNFIRASSEPHSAQLILAVRQVSLKLFDNCLCPWYLIHEFWN